MDRKINKLRERIKTEKIGEERNLTKEKGQLNNNKKKKKILCARIRQK